MTPYEIDVLLYYGCHCDDHPDLVRNPPIWDDTIRRFLQEGLLQIETKPLYAMTERGYAYIEALQRVPLPVQKWVMPDAR